MNGNRKPNLFPGFTGALFLSLMLMTWPLAGIAETPDGGQPGDWLTSYRSARSMGLGGAFTAVADQPLGMLWNPAGMTQLGMNEVFVESTRLFEDTTVNGLSFVAPGTRFPTLGFSVLALRSGAFQKTNGVNDDFGSFQEKETAFLFSASHDVASFLSVGGNLRVIRQSIDEWSSSGFGFDLGAMARVTPSLRVGAALINIGGPSLTLRETNETYPTQITGGMALDLLQNRALITAELVQVEGFDPTGRGGAEIWIGDNFALRAGFDKTSPAGGFSFQMPNLLRIDYGAIGHELGITHRFGVSWQFGGFFASSQADPVVFSPLGRNSTTRFHLSSNTRNDVASWTLDIKDRSGKQVRTFGGRGTPPEQVMWDGKANTGDQLPDGSYLYHLVVSDATGHRTESPVRTIQINTKINEVSVPIQVGSR
ncbi:MAG: PorV/PorQ family protein [Gemmatimonadales bacterium]|nr:PorV/PorQ family protein [Gemmatimonadales bacterium]